ncbi:helix-turn-helix domain-containing protein, partial [Kitasatospora sp. NPDC001225]
MIPDAPRLLRADAARNAEKIIQAAREVFTEQGPDAHLDDVARRAGVGAATLFRRFPDKAALLRAVLDQGFGERVRPEVFDRHRKLMAEHRPQHYRGDAVFFGATL